jgi:hypothetical protein
VPDVTVRVTAAHLATCRRRYSPRLNPVAVAASPLTGWCVYCTARGGFLLLHPADRDRKERVPSPPSVSRFLIRWDRGQPVAPFEFTLPMPEGFADGL